ncbi:amino acid permease [Lichenihabitans sp. Uapishka_5]|uniref:amino acid permease n=1 Tax=Lichenihabitans sp. Uapishka_5 TaxID=3037302 RepID=UPI0029E7FFD8|nr:amino acid permease [Lichenihabitans sp. Uapishka_5]MDX7951373.1 amino acid permease [Lichenihabitans sp. Uapishka_5]
MAELHDDDVKTLHSMGYAQELSRRMSGFSNFAISFSIICILAGGITSFPLAMATGSGFEACVGWVIGGVFALVVAASLGQIGSAYPTAGGLYHWSSILGGRGWGWATAWINLLGLVFVVASVNVGVFSLFQGLVAGPILHIAGAADWGFREQTIAVVLITVTQALCNHLGIKLTTMLTDFSGYMILVVAIALTLTFLFWGASFDLGRLTAFVNTTGAPGGGYVPESRPAFIAFLVGLLYPLYTITGFDASAHTAEETVNARVAVPRGMLHAVLWSVVFGFVMAASFILASPDLAATAKDGANAWFNLFNGLPAPTVLKSVLAIGIVVANYICGLAALTSTSRMIFAFARDGGLPASGLWKTVSPTWRTPVPAIWLAAVLSIAATLYSPAFAALAAGCALFLYVSYAMPVAAGLLAEGKTWTEFGPFRLGALSKPFAVIVILGVLVLMVAGIQPPFDILINYAIGLVVLLLALWFGLERRRFKGPPVGREIAQRQAGIVQAEHAVGQEA